MIPDPSTIQTAAGLSTTHGIDAELTISTKEKEILQNLAKKVADLAARPIEAEKQKLWTLHNDLGKTRTLVFCDPENGWNEIITQDMILCINPLMRVWEMHLRKEIHWAEMFRDDKVTEPVFYVPYHYSESGYGLEEIKVGGEDGGSYIYISPIKEYANDFSKLKFSEITVDYQRTNEILNLAHEIFDGLLTVKLRGIWWWTLGMTWDFIKLRGLENLMTDMMLYPDEVHKLMRFLMNATLYKLNFLEKNNLLSLNTGGAYVGSGGFGWTQQLPQQKAEGEKVLLSEMWGFCESQETVAISPGMFAEFIFPYQKPILERFGLNCYGCCEPLDARWYVIKEIPRLRRVSVSPWANVEKMAEYLGDEYIYSRKPSPTDLATPNPDWDRIRSELRDFILKIKDCHVEIIMKDNHTLGNNPMNAVNWCRIAKEEAEKL